MIKVYLNRDVLNRNMMEEEFDIVADPREADYLICWTRIPSGFEDQLNKVIYIAYEPPLTGPVYWAYKNFDKMHTVFTYNPDPNKENQLHITNNPIYYPVSPFFENDVERIDRKIGTRGVYYSGAKCKGMYTNVPNLSGINFKDGRDDVAQYLLDNYKESFIVGVGWPKVTKFKNDKVSWRVTKMKDIIDSKADFHLCIENYLMPYLVSERLHDGIGSDRVMMYLGDPKIEEWIPKDCYIDLMPYFDIKTNSLDCNSIVSLMENMTQEEYDNIILNARKFRDSMNRDGFVAGRDRITKLIINRIKNGVNFVSEHFDGRPENELLETIRPNFNLLDIIKDSESHIKMLDIPKESIKILEIGCGVGRLLNKIYKKGRELHGIDASKDMVELSKKYCNCATISKCDGSGLIDYKDNTFDYVYSLITFQHIPNINVIKKYISESYRVLSKGTLKFQILSKEFVGETGFELKNYHNENLLIDHMKLCGFKNINIKKNSKWIILSGDKND